MTEPRDYLSELESMLRDDHMSHVEAQLPSAPLSSLASEDGIDRLFGILVQAAQVPNGMTRKLAAYGFGQAGDSRAIQILYQCRNAESARGSIEAIDASIKVLHAMPSSKGSTQLERRRAIENAYYNRPLDWQPSAEPAQPAQAQSSGACFIATAASGGPHSSEVEALTRFRDEALARTAAGRAFVRQYYRKSPPVAACIHRYPSLKTPVLWCIVRPLSFLARLYLSRIPTKDGRNP